MVGVLVTLAVVLFAGLAGSALLQKHYGFLDPAEALGVGGAFALGALGLLTLFTGLLPGGILWGIWIWVALLCALVGKAGLQRLVSGPRFRFDVRSLGLIVLSLVALVAVLAPSDMRDWDSLAYHLAVPKLWLNAGRIGYVPGIHHSNFPFTADLLYVWGLFWGGMAGAKAFSLGWYVLGSVAVFGIARRWYGAEKPGLPWIAAYAFAGCPVALWEAGTAYIDVPHGLFCGLAVLYAVGALMSEKRGTWILAGVALGLALGTKHTGLQTYAALGVVLGASLALRRSPAVARLATTLLLALAIASPWYIKSVAYTGNPVYPFFYKSIGGKDWNDWRSFVYTREQKTFGVGTSPASLGHAVLGLAYQPGRYVNPGQTEGRGFPTGSIGFAALLVGALACCTQKRQPREKLLLACVGASLLLWFFLSQQSRYLTSIVVPLAVLAGGVSLRPKLGAVAAGAVFVQALLSLFIVVSTQTLGQIPVVMGQVSATDYQAQVVPFAANARVVNALPGSVKIALYDEVFGFFLDKPYMWANPGHSTLIPVESSSTSEQWTGAMGRLGFTHAYANFMATDAATRDRWLRAMGQEPYSEDERKQMRPDPDLWWRVLFADAVRKGGLRVVNSFPEGATRPRAALFEFKR